MNKQTKADWEDFHLAQLQKNMITTCAKCGQDYEVKSEESANELGGFCLTCNLRQARAELASVKRNREELLAVLEKLTTSLGNIFETARADCNSMTQKVARKCTFRIARAEGRPQ